MGMVAGLIIAGAGLKAAGEIQAARAAEVESKSAQAIANYNAAVQEQQAKAIEQKAKFESIRQAEVAERIKGALRARLAGAGVQLGVGTPLLLEEEQAAELDLGQAIIGYEARIMAARKRSQAAIDIAQGKLYKERGKVEKRAGYIGAGATLLTGFSEAGMFKKKAKT